MLMHDPLRAKYPYASLTKAMSRMLNIKQIESEGLLDYVKRFKEFGNIMKSHVGTSILDKFVKNSREYQGKTDQLLQQNMKDGAFNKWMAYLLIQKSDQAKYGTVMNGLVSQFSMQNNQYPKSITAPTSILSNHRLDNSGVLNKKKWFQSKKNEDETPKNKEDGSKETSFAQAGKDKTCYCCRKKGHISPECPQKNAIKKEDWVFRKATVYVQADGKEDHQDDDSTGEAVSTITRGSSKIGWSAL
jgi:hypothetical protein